MTCRADRQMLQTWNSEHWPAGQPVFAVKVARM
jgi:hypothetical protein